MSKLLDRTVSPQRGWEYLRQMRFRLRSPRPHHEKADPVEQEAWKKKLTQEAVKVQAAHPDADVEVWCEDEHRLGLKPIMRRVWVPEGEQPTATVNWRFKWLWLADSSIPHPDKPIGGFYPRSILQYSTECWRILLDMSVLGKINASC